MLLEVTYPRLCLQLVAVAAAAGVSTSCAPSSPSSRSLITAVRQPFHCSRSPPDSPAGAPLSPSHPTDASCHCDTLGTPEPRAGDAGGFSVSFIPGPCSLLQTTAILFLPAPSFCSPLLHSNQIVKPSLKCLPAPLSRHRRIWPTLTLPSFYPDTFLHSSVKHILSPYVHLQLLGVYSWIATEAAEIISQQILFTSQKRNMHYW